MIVIQKLTLKNYRAFKYLDIEFDPNITVLFAENGGGKSSILHGLSAALQFIQPNPPSAAKIIDFNSDIHNVAHLVSGKIAGYGPNGNCTVACTAQVGKLNLECTWTFGKNNLGKILKYIPGKKEETDSEKELNAIFSPENTWPLLAFYGTNRFSSGKGEPAKKTNFLERVSALQDNFISQISDNLFLSWLAEQVKLDVVRHRKGEPELRLEKAVYDCFIHLVPELLGVETDYVNMQPRFKFKPLNEEKHFDEYEEVNFRSVLWRELSDGFFVVFALVADIARRTIILNQHLGTLAPQQTPGVVLIDEICMHIHPKWQRNLLAGLKKAFPKIQFVVSTHSPQVLSSVKNNQVRYLENLKLVANFAHVEGRDTNSILREHMQTTDRGEWGQRQLENLYAAIESTDIEEAEKLLNELKDKWGTLDSALILAEGHLEDLKAMNDTN
jgi:predicted ATP-binding protein involved in virulence